jgi:hypothetical protein
VHAAYGRSAHGIPAWNCLGDGRCTAARLGRSGARAAALPELRASELESFTGSAAHDILNPVSATQLTLTLAMKRDVAARTRELLERAVRNQLRVRSIIDGLLQFARSGARPEPGATADKRLCEAHGGHGWRPREPDLGHPRSSARTRSVTGRTSKRTLVELTRLARRTRERRCFSASVRGRSPKPRAAEAHPSAR